MPQVSGSGRDSRDGIAGFISCLVAAVAPQDRQGAQAISISEVAGVGKKASVSEARCLVASAAGEGIGAAIAEGGRSSASR